MATIREESIREAVRLRIGADQLETRATEFTCGDDRQVGRKMQKSADEMLQRAAGVEKVIAKHDEVVARVEARVQGRSR